MNRSLRCYLYCTILLLFSLTGSAQDFFFLDSGSGVHKSTAGSTCSNTRLNYCPSGATDIAYYKDTLYAVTSDGQLYRGLASKPALPYTLVAGFQTTVNSLTVDSTGTVYAAGLQTLLSYRPATGKISLLGYMPLTFFSGGDLTFYKGKLYLAAILYDQFSTACLVEVNIQNPSQSAVFMKLKSKNVFGCITLPKSCDDNGFYITSQVNNLSSLTEIDMTGKVELSSSCTYNDFVYGAASATESGARNKPQIDSIMKKQACLNAQNSGAIRIFAGSTGSLQTYTLNGTATNQTGSFTGLAAGSYAIRITTELGCISDTAVAIATASLPSFTADAVNPACSTDNGKINMQSFAAGASLQYSLNKGAYQQGTTFGNLAPGLYTVAAMNESGCTAEKTLALVRPVLDTTGSSIAVQSSTCNAANGSLQVFVPQAVKPLSFSLNGNAPSASGSFQALNPATYKLSVSDALGCRLDTQVVILTTPVPVIDSVSAPAFCADLGNGSIRVLAKQTGGLFTYALNSGTPNQSGVFTGLPAGNYTVRVSNQYGCTRDTAVSIQSIASPVFSFVSAGPSCKGADGFITIQSPAGNDLYSFNSGPYSNLGSFTGLAAGTYGIAAKNAAGCSTAKTAVLVAASLNSKDIAIRTTAPACTGSDGSVDVTAQRLAAPVLFSLDGAVSSNGSFTGLQAAAYKLSVTDGNSCRFDTTLTLVRIFPARPVTEWRKTAPTCPYAADGAVAITVSGSEGPYAVSLNYGPFTFTYVYPKLDAGSYAFAIRNNKGCLTDSFSAQLTVASNAVCNVIRFPNAFTPGGDGHNDLFKPIVRGVLEEYVMMVYNRFGQKVFESYDPAKGWNGTVSQSIQSTGAFVWLSRYKFTGQGQERKTEKGTVMVVR